MVGVRPAWPARSGRCWAACWSQAASWRLIFAINMPARRARRYAGPAPRPGVPGPRDVRRPHRHNRRGPGHPRPGRRDVRADRGPAGGWAGRTRSAALIVGVLLLVAFVAWERRVSLADAAAELFGSGSSPRPTRSPSRSTARSAGRCSCCRSNCRRSRATAALEAGVSLLPLTAMMLALSARSGALAARIGPRLQMSAGPVRRRPGRAAADPGRLSRARTDQVLPAVLVFGLGLATTVAPLTTTAVPGGRSREPCAASPQR